MAAKPSAFTTDAHCTMHEDEPLTGRQQKKARFGVFEKKIYCKINLDNADGVDNLDRVASSMRAALNAFVIYVVIDLYFAFAAGRDATDDASCSFLIKVMLTLFLIADAGLAVTMAGLLWRSVSTSIVWMAPSFSSDVERIVEAQRERKARRQGEEDSVDGTEPENVPACLSRHNWLSFVAEVNLITNTITTLVWFVMRVVDSPPHGAEIIGFALLMFVRGVKLYPMLTFSRAMKEFASQEDETLLAAWGESQFVQKAEEALAKSFAFFLCFVVLVIAARIGYEYYEDVVQSDPTSDLLMSDSRLLAEWENSTVLTSLEVEKSINSRLLTDWETSAVLRRLEPSQKDITYWGHRKGKCLPFKFYNAEKGKSDRVTSCCSEDCEEGAVVVPPNGWVKLQRALLAGSKGAAAGSSVGVAVMIAVGCADLVCGPFAWCLSLVGVLVGFFVGVQQQPEGELACYPTNLKNYPKMLNMLGCCKARLIVSAELPGDPLPIFDRAPLKECQGFRPQFQDLYPGHCNMDDAIKSIKCAREATYCQDKQKCVMPGCCDVKVLDRDSRLGEIFDDVWEQQDCNVKCEA